MYISISFVYIYTNYIYIHIYIYILYRNNVNRIISGILKTLKVTYTRPYFSISET